MSYWYDEIFEEVCRFGVKIEKQLFSKRSDFQLIEVFESKGFGRVLAIDNIFMTSERDEYLYHEMLVNPVMTTAQTIKRILVIGGGDGGAIREVLSFPEVERVVMVEIDGMVVEASKQYLGSIGTAWEDPRLDLRIADGIEFVKNAPPASFDVILLDHSDPVGPAKGLFDRRFYEGCKRLLVKGGVFCLQSESPLLQEKTFLEIWTTLRRVFKRVHPYFGTVPLYATGAWSWTFASDDADPMAIDRNRLALAEARCKYYNGEIHRGAFAVPNRLKKHMIS
jgi:spermidine synthase